MEEKNIIAKRMEDLGITQYRICNDLGFDPVTVRRWRTEEHPSIRAKNLLILADYLQIDVETLKEAIRKKEERSIDNNTPDNFQLTENFRVEARKAYATLTAEDLGISLYELGNEKTGDVLKWTDKDEEEFITWEGKKIIGPFYKTLIRRNDPDETRHARRRFLTQTDEKGDLEKVIVLNIARKYGMMGYVFDSLYTNQPGYGNDIRTLAYNLFPGQRGQTITELYEADDISHLLLCITSIPWRNKLDEWKENGSEEWRKLSSYLENMVSDIIKNGNCEENDQMETEIEYIRWLLTTDAYVSFWDIADALIKCWDLIKRRYYTSHILHILIMSIDYEHINYTMSSEDLYELVDYVGILYTRNKPWLRGRTA